MEQFEPTGQGKAEQEQESLNKATDIFIRATMHDIEWLKMSLPLVNRYARGIRNVVLTCPGEVDTQRIIGAGVVTRELVTQIEESRPEVTWLTAFNYTNAANILMLPPNTIITEHFGPEVFMDALGKIKWREGVPAMIKRKDLAYFSNFIHNQYKVGPDVYFADKPPFKVSKVLSMFVGNQEMRGRYVSMTGEDIVTINKLFEVHTEVTEQIKAKAKRLIDAASMLMPQNPEAEILGRDGKRKAQAQPAMDLDAMFAEEGVIDKSEPPMEELESIKQELSDKIDDELTPNIEAPYQPQEPVKPKPRPGIVPVLRDDTEGSVI